MPKIKVTYNARQATDELRSFIVASRNSGIDRATAKKVGDLTVAEMRKLVAAGSSPIRGAGKFKAYSGKYRKRIQKYGKVNGYKKTLRPVNLKLSGDFMKSLKFETFLRSRGWAVQIGFYEPESIEKEKGHRDGAKGQAERPIIPKGSERLRVDISRKIETIIVKRIEQYLKRKR